MDIRIELLKEHSRENTIRIANFIGKDKAKFTELMNLFLGNEYRVTQRAAWVLTYCTDEHPALTKPYFSRLLENLKTPKIHDAVKRNTLRYFAEQDIPEALQGLALDICFEYLIAVQEKPAVKVHAMQIAFNICKQAPELLEELKVVIEDQMDFGSTGFKNRGNKILMKINQLLKS